MARPSPIGWLLVALAVVTAALLVIAPAAALVAAVVLALLVLAVLAEGMSPNAGWFDAGEPAGRKVEVLSRHLKRGRPTWERTPPDAPDEPADAIWARERERRRSARGGRYSS
jgi:hypothetical protein